MRYPQEREESEPFKVFNYEREERQSLKNDMREERVSLYHEVLIKPHFALILIVLVYIVLVHIHLYVCVCVSKRR